MRYRVRSLNLTDDPEYRQIAPFIRAHHDLLLDECARRENGGVFRGARTTYTQNDWINIFGSGPRSLECVVRAGLAHWEGEDLHVAHYDHDGERKYVEKRRRAANGGRKNKKPLLAGQEVLPFSTVSAFTPQVINSPPSAFASTPELETIRSNVDYENAEQTASSPRAHRELRVSEGIGARESHAFSEARASHDHDHRRSPEEDPDPEVPIASERARPRALPPPVSSEVTPDPGLPPVPEASERTDALESRRTARAADPCSPPSHAAPCLPAPNGAPSRARKRQGRARAELRPPDAALALADALITAIRAHTPTFLVTPTTRLVWARDLELAVRVDGRDPERLVTLIEFAHAGPRDWYRTGVLCGAKVRKLYDEIDISERQYAAQCARHLRAPAFFAEGTQPGGFVTHRDPSRRRDGGRTAADYFALANEIEAARGKGGPS